ncbi:MAG: hypothetical protein J7L79_01540 [Thaumarchaeota archaeon]|nr:hypothetical protein [Nitrososphaerota archaeon]
MSEILVFKGFEVTYNSYYKEILCISEDVDDCFYIKDIPPDQVSWEDAEIMVYAIDFMLVKGTELWSDGKHWIIRGRLEGE